ncbi:NosD domain-containing protein [Methanococcus maripaludis]|uniref:Parallel beta-helix repeat protein n=1 Tax=Methanococcus maripaludis TaxID=39152 RepID=A0A7J9PEL7_METMI|nr:NosD domain-containing protein [Methanococcus maripaludis]MBA2861110.1 parallel beta-helix repeat protein [Methanococcus maripaludis]
MKDLNVKYLIFLALIVLFTSISSVSADNISTVPYVINTPGTHYLANDLFSSSGNAITITCDNVTIDGKEYTISGIGSNEGIYASGVSNITIKNVHVEHCFGGIYLDNVTDSIIENNTANSNDGGIYLIHSSNNTVTGNTANENWIGIEILQSSYNIVTGNTANSNDWGIGIYGSSNNNNITNNTANSNKYGIVLAYYSSNNRITNNTANSNKYGIHIEHSSNNNIFYNIFNNTNNYGPWGSNQNYWNTSGELGGGNYWFTPNGTGWSERYNDTDGDGFCDPYYPLDENNTDYLPIALISEDITAPAVTILSPEGTTYTTNNVTINVTATDFSGVSSVIAEIEGIGNVTLTLNDSYYLGNTGTLSNGNYTVTTYANDTFGNVNSSENVSIIIAVPSSSSSSRSDGDHYSSDLADGFTSKEIKSFVSSASVIFGNEIDQGFAKQLRENVETADGHTLIGDIIIVGGPEVNALAKEYNDQFKIPISNDNPGENKGVIQILKVQDNSGSVIKSYTIVYIAGSDRYGTLAALEYFKTLDELPEGPITVEYTENGPVLVE